MAGLKPCPFCGKKAEIKVNPTTMNCTASCKTCEVTMKRCFKGNGRLKALLEELITEQWNRRVDDENA